MVLMKRTSLWTQNDTVSVLVTNCSGNRTRVQSAQKPFSQKHAAGMFWSFWIRIWLRCINIISAEIFFTVKCMKLRRLGIYGGKSCNEGTNTCETYFTCGNWSEVSVKGCWSFCVRIWFRSIKNFHFEFLSLYRTYYVLSIVCFAIHNGFYVDHVESQRPCSIHGMYSCTYLK